MQKLELIPIAGVSPFEYKPTANGENVSDGELPSVLEQHYIFHSVLNLLSIQSPAYNKDYDIFKK